MLAHQTFRAFAPCKLVLTVDLLAKSKSDGGQSSFLLLLHHFGRFIRKPTTKADEDEDYIVVKDDPQSH